MRKVIVEGKKPAKLFKCSCGCVFISDVWSKDTMGGFVYTALHSPMFAPVYDSCPTCKSYVSELKEADPKVVQKVFKGEIPSYL